MPTANIAYRWFCFLTIDDPVFDHSTIAYFINRIGREGFSEVFDGLNQELLRMGLLSPEMYVDSSMIKANVNNFGLSRSGLSVEEFKEQAIEENVLFALSSSTVDDEGVEHQEVRYFQDARGQLPLSPVDTDARWRTTRSGKPSGLNYQENVVVHLGGFILSRGVTHASEGEWKVLPELLERLPLKPVSLASDTAYSVGQLRELLEGKGITAYIPIHPNQQSSMVAKGDFIYRGDHLICPQGKVLRRSALQRRDRPISTWPTRRTANPVPSKSGACHPTRNEGTWPSACITLCCSRRRN